MRFEHPHFLYVEGKEPDTGFAQTLIAGCGQSPVETADVLVCVGGDGLLLKTLRDAAGKPVFAVKPPGSNSRGFWTDHNVTSPAELLEKLETAQIIRVAPLEARIGFANGNEVIRHAFNDVAIERASGQSITIELSARFGETAVGPLHVTGDGFVFSSALGSTGTSRSYGGPVVDVHSDVIILVGKGIYEPRGGLAPLIAQGMHTEFHTEFYSVAHKRPVRIDYDGLSVVADTDGSQISRLDISLSKQEKSAQLLVTGEPGIRSFAAITP